MRSGSLLNLFLTVAAMCGVMITYEIFNTQLNLTGDNNIVLSTKDVKLLEKQEEDIFQLLTHYRLELDQIKERDVEIAVLLEKQKADLERAAALQNIMVKPESGLRVGNLQTDDASPNDEGKLSDAAHVTDAAVFQARKERVQEVCSKYSNNVSGIVKTVYRDVPTGVLYCMVPKAGCTFWKSVFHAVKTLERNKITGLDVFGVSRYHIHNTFRRKDSYAFNETAHSPERFPRRLLVTRDPYSRLLSTYLDKSYLPDFWFSENMKMFSKMKDAEAKGYLYDDSGDFLRQHFNGIANILEFKYANLTEDVKISTRKDDKCFKYLTFVDFVRFGLYRNEPHWMPIHTICNPCKYQATHIGTMETFVKDARAVLGKMDLEYILDDMDSDKQVDTEIAMLVEYHFNLFHRYGTVDSYRGCLTDREVAFRLWHNFRWRGYIDPDIDYVIPKVEDETSVRNDLLEQLSRARASGLNNKGRMKEAKKMFKKQAFKTIPKRLFEKINEKYKIDFEFFGYENKREELQKTYE